MNYTTIDHERRKQLDLSLNEYVIADYIFNLANNKKSKVKGWCYASKKTMSREFGITKANIIAIISRLVAKKVVEKDNDTKFLRPAKLWESSEKLSLVSKQYHRYRNNTATGIETIPVEFQNHAQTGIETIPNNNNKIYKEILDTWNTSYKSKYKSPNTLKSNLDFWLDSYSLKEIKKAIAAASRDDWWGDKTPAMFFRRKDKAGESVDRIGEFLSKAPAQVEYKVIGGQK